MNKNYFDSKRVRMKVFGIGMTPYIAKVWQFIEKWVEMFVPAISCHKSEIELIADFTEEFEEESMVFFDFVWFI